MPDEQDPKGQVPDGQQDGDPKNPAGQEPEEFDKERALATIRKLRESEKLSKQQAKELEQLKAKLQEHENAKLSETEKLQKRIQELEAKHADFERERTTLQRERQEQATRYEILLHASKKGIIDPDAAYKLLDLAELEFDDDGRPQNVEKVLDKLLKDKPYLKGQGGGSTIPGTPKPGDEQALNEQERRKRAVSARMYW